MDMNNIIKTHWISVLLGIVILTLIVIFINQKSKINNLESEIDSLEYQLSNCENELNECQDDLSNCEDELDNCESNNWNLQSEINDAELDLWFNSLN